MGPGCASIRLICAPGSDRAGLGEGRADPAIPCLVLGGAAAAIAMPAADGAARLRRAGGAGSCNDGVVFCAPQVNLYVADIGACVGFYRDLLGFTETFRTAQQGTPAHVELRLDGFTLGLATVASLRDVHGVTAGTGPPRAEVVVWTDDVDAAFSVLSAKGVRVLSPPHDFLASLRATWMADPEGNPVQIVMRREGTPPENLARPLRLPWVSGGSRS
jgi:catechol 2,3-dioxygenase-like lactoylglutathione lyase family enzyme